jgi:hypothetical protein
MELTMRRITAFVAVLLLSAAAACSSPLEPETEMIPPVQLQGLGSGNG